MNSNLVNSKEAISVDLGKEGKASVVINLKELRHKC